MKYIKGLLYTLPAVAILIGIANNNYLLFHTLAELFSIVIAFGIFVIGWNSRQYFKNNYLLFIGIAYLFVAFFDTLHTIAYKGMGVFKGYDDNNLPPQLWIFARYLESIALLVAPIFLTVGFRYKPVFLTFSTVSIAGLYSIFYARIFPTCFIVGTGLTPFKRISEYVINFILLLALLFLYKRKEYFDAKVLHLLTLSILCTMVTELCFTVYVNLYGISNLVGHVFKVFSFLFMYKAIIETALTKPYDILFKELQDQKDTLLETSEINQKIIAESVAGILAYRVDTGECILANEAAATSIGASVQVLEKQNFREIPSWKKSGLFEAAEQVIATGIGMKSTFNISTTFGKNIISECLLTLFNSGGERHLLLIFDDITERRLTQLELQSSEERYKSLFSGMTEGFALHEIVCDDRGVPIDYRFLEINPAFERLTGMTRAAVIGRCMTDILPGEAPQWVDRYGKVALSGVSDHFENYSPALQKYFEVFAYRPAELQFAVMFIDITAQKQADEIVIKANDRLLEAQRLARIGNWELDLETGQLFWSDEIFRIFEIDPRRFGASYEAFLNAIHPDDRGQVNDAYATSLETHTPYSVKHRLLMADGRIKYVMEQCESCFDSAGKPLRSSGTVQDITELEKARLAVEEASKVKSEFLANMSHEVRTPMNGILGMARLLRNTPLTEAQKEHVDIIILSANDLMQQINDILEFARMEAEQIDLEYAPFSLNNCALEVFKAQHAQISAKRLDVFVSVADDVPENVVGDVFRVKQILLNLIGNALKFTESGEVAVVISLAEKDERGIVVNLAVQDTGIGIPESALESVFQPFVQADGSISRKFGGTGLGLSISRKLARLMGGEIYAENRPCGGCVFHFSLPCPIAGRISDVEAKLQEMTI